MRAWLARTLVPAAFAILPLAHAGLPEVTAGVKPSVTAIGTFDRTRVPPFRFLGTGFAVADGTLVATNLHVAAAAGERESLAVALPRSGQAAEIRPAKSLASDADHDLVLLRIDGNPLPALRLATAEVREGQDAAFVGYPIGAVLGLFPAVHRGIVSAISPIVLPRLHSQQLDRRVLARLRDGAFPIYQLDATAYPGNSGSPLIDPASGEVIGIVNMTFVKGTRESALSSPSGISFAIPAAHLIDLLRANGVRP